MKNLLLLALALFCPLAVAQTPVPVAPISGQAVNQYGQPIPYAQIRVCPVTSTGIPCTPLASLYQDYYLTIPLANPIAGDQYGNYLAYVGTASPVNLYTIQVSATQGLTWSYVENGPATGGGGGGGTVTLVSCGNLYPLFTCSVANPNSTPAISFALSTAPNFSFFGNFSGALAAPSFWTLDAGTGITLTPSGNTLTIAAEPPQQFTVFQQNGINVPDQSLLNASNTTPAAPSGYQNVAWQNDSSGDWSAYYASILLELQQQITPPNGVTQYLILFPTTVTTSGDQESNTVSASTQSAYIVHPECGLGSCYEGSIYATWGGFVAALTAYGVTTSQVTAVYPFTTSATDGCVAFGYFPNATVTWANSSTSSSGTLFISNGGTCPAGNIPLAYYLDSTSIGTGSSLADVTMQSSVSALDPDQGGINLTTSAVGVIVAYTGTPVTVPSYIGVEPPLQLSSASGQTLLGIDPNAVFPITLGNATILGNSTTTMDSVLTLTTTGSSGAATLTGNTLNIPQYSGGSSGFPITLGSTSIAASSTTTAVTGLEVNGVTLNAAGSPSLFLNQAGGYTTPAGGGSGTVANCSTQYAFFYAAVTGTTATCDPNITDNGAQISIAEATTWTSTITPTQWTLEYNPGYSPSGSAGKAVFAPDTTGNLDLNPDNTSFTPLVPLASGFVSGHCGEPTESGGIWTMADSGSDCGSSSGGVTDGSGTTTANEAAMSTTTAHQIQYSSDVKFDVGGTPNVNVNANSVGVSLENVQIGTVSNLSSFTTSNSIIGVGSLARVSDGLACGDTTTGGGSTQELLSCITMTGSSCSAWTTLTCNSVSSANLAPASIPTLTYWWAADQITGQSNSNGLMYWISQYTGNAGLANTSPGPTYLTNQLNSLPAVSFPGSSVGELAIQYPVILTQSTVFVVFKAATVSAIQPFLYGAADAYYFRIENTGYLGVGKSDVVNIGIDTTCPLTAGTWYQANVTYDGVVTGDWAFRVGRSACSSGTSLQSITVATSQLAYDTLTPDYFDGEIAEIIVYGRVLTSTEITTVENYLHSKWGV